MIIQTGRRIKQNPATEVGEASKTQHPPYHKTITTYT